MRVTVKQQIKADIDSVFSFISHPEGYPEAIDGILKVEILSEQKSGLGCRFKETRMMYGKEASEIMEFSKVEAPYLLESTAASHGASYRSWHKLSQVDDAVVELELGFEGIAQSFSAKIFSILSIFFVGGIRKALEADLLNLKEYLEQKAEA